MKLILNLDVAFAPPDLDVSINVLWLDSHVVVNVMQHPTKETVWLWNILDNP